MRFPAYNYQIALSAWTYRRTGKPSKLVNFQKLSLVKLIKLMERIIHTRVVLNLFQKYFKHTLKKVFICVSEISAIHTVSLTVFQKYLSPHGAFLHVLHILPHFFTFFNLHIFPHFLWVRWGKDFFLAGRASWFLIACCGFSLHATGVGPVSSKILKIFCAYAI